MILRGKLGLLCLFSFISIALQAQENYKDVNTKNEHTVESVYEVKNYDQAKLKFRKKPKNVILLIGDGMGVSHVFAGMTANKGALNIQNMKNIGFSKTQSGNNYITDSAAGGTALACGVKTYNNAIGMDINKQPVKSILHYAEDNKKATGLVSTSAITHATPASFIAHVEKRVMYEDIASDFLNTDINVFIGGGYKHFTERKDGRNLVDELKGKGYMVYTDLDASSSFKDGKLAVLTADEHNPKYDERGNMLELATKKSLEILSNAEEDGFFLMVEGSQIDWGSHQNDASYVVGEVLDFDQTVGAVLEFAVKDKSTLVIVTADHETSGMSLEKGNMKKGYIKAGFTTGSHTGVMVPVFAFGSGAEEFQGIYENTEIFNKIFKLMRFKKD
ncbi:alkaline phosphatase [Maribellus luteus]|uniref:Alkaline phosphatase n=2 Tax=Maribellus luteus TaxID=2305463 RepID=A0A399SR09_9BACT|nr:alkaline phosphatase [Maribellus luteus]